ncbi:MAG TPA: hypothetical protein VE871_21075 [Longimicrobium sp.]|nr:hypothetical protein [Longimicrobium sp.]
MSAPATLVLAVLSIESSYAGDVERPARGVPDTVQFWLAADGQWTLRTHAADHDLRVHRITARPDGSPYAAEQAEALIEKHYADVAARRVTLPFPNPADAEDVARILASKGLSGCLVVMPDGWSFYNPDGAEYRPRSAL